MVYNGTDALDYITNSSYDAVVLDIMMPGMNGLEVLTRARAMGIKTPVMLLTAKGEVDDRVAGLKCGADDYLPKPLRHEREFVARVRALTHAATITRIPCWRWGTRSSIAAATLSCGGETVTLSNKGVSAYGAFHAQSAARVFKRACDGADMGL